MRLRFLFIILSLWTSSVLTAELSLFTPEERCLLEYLKSPRFLFEKSLEERRDEAQRFFLFVLGLDTKEDQGDLGKLNFSFFSKVEDEDMIRESRDRFLEEMQKMEVHE